MQQEVSKHSVEANATTVQQEVSVPVDVNVTMLYEDVPVPDHATGIINDTTPEQNVLSAELVEADKEMDVNDNSLLSEHYDADLASNYLDNCVRDSAPTLAADNSSVSAVEIATVSYQLLEEVAAVAKIIENQPLNDASQPIDADGFQLVKKKKMEAACSTGILVHFFKPHTRQNCSIVEMKALYWNLRGTANLNTV